MLEGYLDSYLKFKQDYQSKAGELTSEIIKTNPKKAEEILNGYISDSELSSIELENWKKLRDDILASKDNTLIETSKKISTLSGEFLSLKEDNELNAKLEALQHSENPKAKDLLNWVLSSNENKQWYLEHGGKDVILLDNKIQVGNFLWDLEENTELQNIEIRYGNNTVRYLPDENYFLRLDDFLPGDTINKYNFLSEILGFKDDQFYYFDKSDYSFTDKLNQDKKEDDVKFEASYESSYIYFGKDSLFSSTSKDKPYFKSDYQIKTGKKLDRTY